MFLIFHHKLAFNMRGYITCIFINYIKCIFKKIGKTLDYIKTKKEKHFSNLKDKCWSFPMLEFIWTKWIIGKLRNREELGDQFHIVKHQSYVNSQPNNLRSLPTWTCSEIPIHCGSTHHSFVTWNYLSQNVWPFFQCNW